MASCTGHLLTISMLASSWQTDMDMDYLFVPLVNQSLKYQSAHVYCIETIQQPICMFVC